MQNNTYGNIKIEPFRDLTLTYMSIISKIGEHYTAYIKGILPDLSSYTKVNKTTSVLIKQNEQVIFNGVIQSISAKKENDLIVLEIHAVSSSFLIDVEKKSRSFQNKKSSYREIVNQIASGYSNVILKDNFSDGKITGKYIVQYRETDWEFLKRMASRFNSVLIPHVCLDGVEIHAGTPKVSPAENVATENYAMIKNLSNFELQSKNGNSRIRQSDGMMYEFTYNQFIKTGYPFIFNGYEQYINSSVIKYEKDILTFNYTSTDKEGISTTVLKHPNIEGLSIQGKVIDRISDTVKVHLEIDNKQDVATAWKFPYSTNYSAEGNSGWYCMPELGDTVNIYHSDDEESNAFAIGGTRKSQEKITRLSNPDVKYFRTANGKELKFAPDEVLITANDDKVYIRMSEKKGIKMKSNKPIQITTSSDLKMTASGSIYMDAYEKIDISCQSSKLTLKPDEISLKSGKIKHN